jgi:DEAD/DEAH box helicase domain-containing protein
MGMRDGQKTLVFDLESQRLADEVGGWANIAAMGFAAGVTLEVETGQVQSFLEDDLPALISDLHQANRVIGYNLLRFDYEVLKPYGLRIDRTLLSKTTDMLRDLELALGFRLPLDVVAEATLGEHKTADGIQSVRWYKAGEIEKVLAYCEHDVLVTHRVWDFGRENGFVRYYDRRGGVRKISVSW